MTSNGSRKPELDGAYRQLERSSVQTLRRAGLALLAAFTFAGPHPTAILAQTGSEVRTSEASGFIYLWVRDKETHYGVPATIQLQGPDSLTLQANDEGRITPSLQKGRYEAVFSAPGYKTQTYLRGGFEIAPGKTQKMYVMLEPERTPEGETPEAINGHIRPGFTVLHGYVVDVDSGKPVSGAKVRVGLTLVETDASGHYWLSVPMSLVAQKSSGGKPVGDLWRITFAKPGYKTVINELIVYGGELREPPIDLERGSGVVSDRPFPSAGGTPLRPPQSAPPSR